MGFTDAFRALYPLSPPLQLPIPISNNTSELSALQAPFTSSSSGSSSEPTVSPSALMSSINNNSVSSSHVLSQSRYLGIKDASFMQAQDVITGVNHFDVQKRNSRPNASYNFDEIVDRLRYRSQPPPYQGERKVVRKLVNHDLVCIRLVRTVTKVAIAPVMAPQPMPQPDP